MVQTHEWEIQIDGESAGICQWITDHDGPSGLVTQDILQLTNSFITGIPPSGYTFSVTTQQIFGVILYMFGDVAGGNAMLGCGF